MNNVIAVLFVSTVYLPYCYFQPPNGSSSTLLAVKKWNFVIESTNDTHYLHVWARVFAHSAPLVSIIAIGVQI